MTPRELKNSILQRAIQGRLVEQRPEEGTGEELYREIQAEKRRLVQAGKIKKEKPLPEITEDDIPFDIPESWKWVHLSEVTYPVGNKNNQILAKRVTKSGKYPAVSQGFSLIDGYCDEEKRVIYDLPLVMFGDHTRNVKYIDFPFVISADGTKFLKSIVIDSKYLFFWTGIIAEQLRNRGYARHFSLLKQVPLPIPPLPEQHRIVAKIEELLTHVDRYGTAWNRLEAFNQRFPSDMRKSLLQLAIRGRLVEQRPEEGTGEELYREIQKEKQRRIRAGELKREKPLPEIAEDEIPFEIPESWKWVRLLNVVRIASNLVKPSSYSDYPHIAPDNIEKHTGNLFGVKTVREDKVISTNHLFYKGQILYSKIRPLLRKAVIAPFDGLCSADMYPLDTDILPQYLLFYLLSDSFNNQIASIMSSRVKMPKINRDELGQVIIPLPPIPEQRRIVEKLEEIMPLCERLR